MKTKPRLSDFEINPFGHSYNQKYYNHDAYIKALRKWEEFNYTKTKPQ